MKVKVENLGGGLTRIEVQPSACEPRHIPTAVVDDIARDVIKREKTQCHTCQSVPTRPTWTSTPTWERPLPTPNREPDGIDIHVDRPRRENYGGVQWAAENAFRSDLAKYRSLEALAKQCNWPAREPMKGAPNYRNLAAQQPQTKHVAVPAPRPCGCAQSAEKEILREAISILASLID